MPDEQLRKLERLAAEGDVLAAGQLLGERTRHGSLDLERLLLAAHLGDPASLTAVGSELTQRLSARQTRLEQERKANRPGFFLWLHMGLVFGFGPDPFWAETLDRKRKVARRELVDWVEALELFDKEACLRVALASARAGLPRSERFAETSQHAITQVEAWLRCPCDEHLTSGGFGMVLWDDDVTDTCQWAERSAFAAWAVLSAQEATQAAHYAALAAQAAFFLELDVRDAIRAEVVPWALGLADPVAPRPEGDPRREETP